MPALAIARANSIKTNNYIYSINLYAYIKMEEEKVYREKKYREKREKIK